MEEAASRRRRTSILRCPLISLMRDLMGPSFSFDSVNNTARPPLPSQFDFLACDSPRLVIMSSRINVITRTRVGKRGRKRDVSVRRADDSCGRNKEGRERERAMSRMLLTQVATDLSSSTRAISATVNRENQLSHLQVLRVSPSTSPLAPDLTSASR